MDRIERIKSLVTACDNIGAVRTVELIVYTTKESNEQRFALLYIDKVNRLKYLTTGLHLKMTDIEYLMVRASIQDFILINVVPSHTDPIDIDAEIDLRDAVCELPWENTQDGIIVK